VNLKKIRPNGKRVIHGGKRNCGIRRGRRNLIPRRQVGKNLKITRDQLGKPYKRHENEGVAP